MNCETCKYFMLVCGHKKACKKFNDYLMEIKSCEWWEEQTNMIIRDGKKENQLCIKCGNCRKLSRIIGHCEIKGYIMKMKYSCCDTYYKELEVENE